RSISQNRQDRASELIGTFAKHSCAARCSIPRPGLIIRISHRTAARFFSASLCSATFIFRRGAPMRYTSFVCCLLLAAGGISASAADKPNILVIWGDDIGTWNISHNNRGMMGYRTPNIDRLAKEGLSFTDYYGQQSCTAGRAAFIGGNVPVRTGMTKVGLPGAKEGWQKTDVTMATVLKSLGYATGQFGKNHQGDRDEHLPTVHGFDEYFGSLYHLNASEEPENFDYPKDMKLP